MKKGYRQFFILTMIMTLFMTTVFQNKNAYASESIPKVEKVLLENAKVYKGDVQTINVLSKSSSNVQYRVWICNKRLGKWEDITHGYTKSMNQNQILRVTTPKLYEGDYTISIWIKKAGKKPLNKKGFDTYFVSNMKCLKNNGQAPNIKIDSIKNNYAKGQIIGLKKQDNKNYSYKYSIYDLTTNKTLVAYDKNYKESFSWKANKDGIYILKVKVKSVDKVKIQEDNNTNKNKEEESSNIKKNEKDKLENNNIESDIKEDDKKEEDNIKKEDIKEEDIKDDEKLDDKKSKDEKELKESDTLDKIQNGEDKEEDKEENKDNELIKEQTTKEDKKIIEKDKEDVKQSKSTDNKIQYKEIIKEEEITKLIIVGSPYRGPKAPKVESILVGRASETSRIYIKNAPSSKSRNIGYIYGSLQGVKVLKKVGTYYCIETTDYGTLRKVKGYVPGTSIKKIKPRQDYIVKVEIAKQHISVFKNGRLIKTIVCSTGKSGTPTPTGTYLIGSRGAYFLTGYNDSVICHNWVRFNYNFLFHSVLYRRSGQIIKSEAAKLGTRASHGCIRMSLSDIKWVYSNIPKGTPVVIQ